MLRATTACTFSTSQLPKVVGKDGSKDAATSVGTLQGEWVGISATREPKMLNRAGDQRIRAITSAARDADDLIKLKSYNAASITTSSERSTSVPSDDDGQEFLNEWDEWSEHEVGHGPKARWENIHYDFNTGKVLTPAVIASTTMSSEKTIGKSQIDHIASSIPCMLFAHQDFGHREKVAQNEMKFGKMYNAMVSRPVGRKEMMEDPDAKASMRNEWLGQHRESMISQLSVNTTMS